jgi:tetratricopeptide (TPR) repeat protein
MRAGDVIAERFEIERLSGSGGMGQVYRAKDRLSGEAVAVKVLHGSGVHEAERFAQEAELLSTLRHPGIVAYVAYGATGDGDPYLVMEWLEGETLADRLRRCVLTVGETVTLTARVAAALGAVHRGGVVHRDLKPSNVLFRGPSFRSATLIDFGIARLAGGGQRLTTPGAMLGTPGYVAPEQARGEEVDARADVFSLGCVLFKCLTGRGPFVGDDALSVLLKIIVEEPPRLGELLEGVPPGIEDLVARMLSKSPADRPPDGDAIGAELEALDAVAPFSTDVFRAPPSLRAPGITTTERRVMSLVLGRAPRGDPEATRTAGESADRQWALRAAVERHQGRLELLADRSIAVVLTSTGAATDLAVRAARCALSLRALLDEGAEVAVASGRAVLSPRFPAGELIDRAVHLLGSNPEAAATIHVDEVTAGLLGARFDVAGDGRRLCLRGERDAFDAARTLLGKPTECVGRERELAQLEVIFAGGALEQRPGVVLVTGPAGAGKSRLRDELIQRLRRRGEEVEIWFAEGDPTSAGSAFGMLARALRRALDLHGGEPIEARRDKLRARLAERLPADAREVSDFIGELTGVPFPDEDRPQLRAARRDPILMSDRLRHAFEALLRAQCASRPLLLVLEDLHWGDLPTVKLVDGALRGLDDQPFGVLAFARPEVHALFPRLWAERGVQEIALGALPRRACERLIKQTLGGDVRAETVAALLERADGNAFYLEELIRAVAEGKGATLPETVLAMVEARLEALDAEQRRVLRAASVFGQTFWQGGVAAVLGKADVSAWLAGLVEQEVISRRSEGRFPGEIEHRFRHGLVREAAYRMLTEGDRGLGHRLAGAWLAQAGEDDALALAEHFERGGDAGRAAESYQRAVGQAFEGNDLGAALAWVERAMACLSACAERDLARTGELQVLAARAHRWRGENAEAERAGLEAMSRLPRGDARWCEAVMVVVGASGALGDVDRQGEIARELLALPEPGSDGVEAAARAMALGRTAVNLLHAGCYDRVEPLLARAEAIARRVEGDPMVLAQVGWARSLRALVEGDLGVHLELASAACARFVEAGDLRFACFLGISIEGARVQLGAFAEAERALGALLAEAERMSLPALTAYARKNLGLALARLGRIDEGRAVAEAAVAAFRAQQNRRVEAVSRITLATILVLAGDLEGAAAEAGAVAGDPGAVPPARAHALATLASARIAAGRAAEALPPAREALGILSALGGVEEGEALVRLTWAEALDGAGEAAGARAAIAEARARLLDRAARIADPGLRRSFVEAVPENARTRWLATRWLSAAR